MFQKIATFWRAFWNALKSAYNKAFKEVPKEKTQEYRDTKRINFLAIFVSKLNNLVNTESTYDVESDSVQAEPLQELCKDLEAKRFDITAEMLGTGDYWIFPSHTDAGELFHRYVSQDRVRILDMDGENITDIIGVIDEFVDNENKVFFLNRRHTLEGDTLTVETYTTNERNEKVILENWLDFEGVWQFSNANHIGVGRFKSPVSSRGLSAVYGVPLNFGCEEIEEKIFHDLEMIETEFSHGESKIFADPLVMKKGRGKDGLEEWQMPEGMFPINHRAGDSGASIDIFSPVIRYSEYQGKLMDDMRQYEQQVGTDRGFLTPYDNGTAVTATEIRRANASTIALINKVHASIKDGVEMTLKADAVFLNVAEDLWSVSFDFFDAFEDSDSQWARLVEAYNAGAAEVDDLTRWIFPNLTQEEIEEKLERIRNQSQVDTDSALERILNSGA